MTLHDLSVQEMLQGLREGRLDAALTVASSSKQMRGLVFEHLRTYPLYLAINASHRLARAKRVNLSQLKDEHLIVYSRADYPEYHEWLASMFQSLGAMPEIAEEHDSATSLIAAIEAGRGIALVASVLSSLAGSRLMQREIQPSPMPLVVGVAYHRHHLSPAARRFIKTASLLAAGA